MCLGRFQILADVGCMTDSPAYEGLYAFTLYGRTCPDSDHEGHGFPCWKMLEWDRITTDHLEDVISNVGKLIEERCAGKRPEPMPPDPARESPVTEVNFLALARARTGKPRRAS